MLIINKNFYKAVLKSLIKNKTINLDSKILIAAGGAKDRRIFLELGFKNVTVSNVDTRMDAKSFLPYKWDFMDVENLKYRDNQFDFAVIHHGLHHCKSPHRGLLELYRVSKYGLIAFEPLDNLITRTGIMLGFSENYELTAVYDGDFKYGGLCNTCVPNFVYRWTSGEIVKTISGFEPRCRAKVKFFYGLELPSGRLGKLKNMIFYFSMIFSYPFLLAGFLLFHKSVSNRFGFFIGKPDLKKDLYPWLRQKGRDTVVNEEYFTRRYK